MSRFAQSCQIGIKQASEEYWSSSVTKSWATVTYAKQVTMRKGDFVHQRILLHWFSMFCVSRNAYKMIIFAHSKCKRYENRKIQVLLYLKKSGMDKNGKAPIMGRITVNRTMAQFSCKLSCTPSLWNPRASRLEGKSKEAVETNKDIEQLLLSIQKAFDVLVEKSTDLPISTIRDDTRSPASLRWRQVCRCRPSARCSVIRMWRWRSGMREWPQRKRILRFDKIKTNGIRIVFDSARACPCINNVSGY